MNTIEYRVDCQVRSQLIAFLQTSSIYLHQCLVLNVLLLFSSLQLQLLQHLHSENKLSRRFPIGLEEQIKKWDADKIRKFHERWYFPANATLYIVGDIDNISKAVSQIEVCFNHISLNTFVSILYFHPTPLFWAISSLNNLSTIVFFFFF